MIDFICSHVQGRQGFTLFCNHNWHFTNETVTIWHSYFWHRNGIWFFTFKRVSKMTFTLYYVRGTSQNLNRVRRKIVWRKHVKADLPIRPGWKVWAEAEAAEVADATPTAPASMTSPEEEVVSPSCCRDEPGISSAGKQNIKNNKLNCFCLKKLFLTSTPLSEIWLIPTSTLLTMGVPCTWRS